MSRSRGTRKAPASETAPLNDFVRAHRERTGGAQESAAG